MTWPRAYFFARAPEAKASDKVSIPFARWAASMRHIPTGEGRSTLVYTYTLETWPAGARWLMEPVVDHVLATPIPPAIT